MDWKIITLCDDIDNALDIAEIQVRVDALSIEVESKVDNVNVSRPFAVAKQATFYSISACKNGKLGSCDTGPPIVMRVQTDNYFFTFGDVSAEILDLNRVSKQFRVGTTAGNLPGRRSGWVAPPPQLPAN